MRVILGPMEGVLDHLMRDRLTQINDYDFCVTEFVRVVNLLLPDHVFYRLCPELRHGPKTPSGVPVKYNLAKTHTGWLKTRSALLSLGLMASILISGALPKWSIKAKAARLFAASRANLSGSQSVS